jgi:hypothetical protein
MVTYALLYPTQFLQIYFTSVSYNLFKFPLFYYLLQLNALLDMHVYIYLNSM